MKGALKERLSPGALYDLTRVHDRHFIRLLRHHTQVMSDEQEGHPQPLLQLLHQLQDLGLDGHVQSGGRFIRYQDTRITRQGHGDHHPLTHAPAQLMRIVIDP